MKAVRDFRDGDSFDADDMRKGTKIPPVKKSGKERYNIYSGMDDDEFDEPVSRRESVFDYFDDEEDDL